MYIYYKTKTHCHILEFQRFKSSQELFWERSLNMSSPVEEWEFKQRGFITSQLLAHYFLGVGSLRLLFLPSEAAEGGRIIGPAGCFCWFYKESSISHCGDLALMAGHRQGQHPPIAWMTSIVGSRRDSMVFCGGLKPQVIFFRHSAAGGGKTKDIWGGGRLWWKK